MKNPRKKNQDVDSAKEDIAGISSKNSKKLSFTNDNDKIFDFDEKNSFTIKLTKDRLLLNQYYELRNKIFQEEREWTSQTWLECEDDLRSDLIVAVDKNNKVIGGCRVMISYNGEALSDEKEGTEFVYKNLLKEYDLDFGRYSEINGLVIEKQHRSIEILSKILLSCINHSNDQKCNYIFGVANQACCRLYKMAYAKVGYQDVIISKKQWSCLAEYNFSVDYPIINIINKLH